MSYVQKEVLHEVLVKEEIKKEYFIFVQTYVLMEVVHVEVHQWLQGLLRWSKVSAIQTGQLNYLRPDGGGPRGGPPGAPGAVQVIDY